jgi:hypothetical protein
MSFIKLKYITFLHFPTPEGLKKGKKRGKKMMKWYELKKYRIRESREELQKNNPRRGM